MAGLLIKYGASLMKIFILIDLEVYLLNGKYSRMLLWGYEKEWDDPQFRENFELLSIRASKWLETHPQTTK